MAVNDVIDNCRHDSTPCRMKVLAPLQRVRHYSSQNIAGRFCRPVRFFRIARLVRQIYSYLRMRSRTFTSKSILRSPQTSRQQRLDWSCPNRYNSNEPINQFTESTIKPHSKNITSVVSALTARTQFGQIMKRASQKNERFVVGRRGEPSVIIMSIRDYVDMVAPIPDWLEQIGAEAKRKGLNKLTMGQIDAEIAATRKDRRQKTALASPAK